MEATNNTSGDAGRPRRPLKLVFGKQKKPEVASSESTSEAQAVVAAVSREYIVLLVPYFLRPSRQLGSAGLVESSKPRLFLSRPPPLLAAVENADAVVKEPPVSIARSADGGTAPVITRSFSAMGASPRGTSIATTRKFQMPPSRTWTPSGSATTASLLSVVASRLSP